MFSTSRRKEERRLDRLALGVPYADKSQHRALEPHRRVVTGVVAATPGSFLREQSSGARRERPHPATFPGAVGDELHSAPRPDESDSECSIRFSGLEIPRLRRSDAGLTNFIGFEIDEEYLREAQRRLGEATRLACSTRRILGTSPAV